MASPFLYDFAAAYDGVPLVRHGGLPGGGHGGGGVQNQLHATVLCGEQGGGMLFLQAYYADCYFLGKQADEQEAHNLYKKYLESEENI